MSSKERANLARIRDNQRRSRARRKEYLQELEARLRKCELQGVEASSEIQMAARRVADENKRLRGLLAQHGVSDDTVEAYLHKSPAETMDTTYGNKSGAVQGVEQLLQTRKGCCTEEDNPLIVPINGEDSHSNSASTAQSLWDPIYLQNTSDRHHSGALQLSGNATSSSVRQFMTPSNSTASRASSVSVSHRSNRGVIHYHQRNTLRHVPQNPSLSPNPCSPDQQMFNFDPLLPVSNSITYQNIAQKDLEPHSPQQISSDFISTTSSANVNNCNYATDIISTMAGITDASAVRADLGCLPGMDCEVDNQLVFNVMDRYSGNVGG